MFGKLFKVIDNVQNLNQDEIAVFIYYDKDIQRLILRENRIDQLSHGLAADGKIIGTYSPITDISSDGLKFTFEETTVEKIAGEPYNFIDTGDFFTSFRMVVYKDGFSIVANDQKEDGSLTAKYGNNILGLTNENKSKLVKEMLPLFRAITRKKILA